MKWLTASPLLLLLAAAPAHAQWEPPNEVLQVLIAGQGDWSVRCEYQDPRDRTMVREAKGRGERLHLSRPRSGACAFQAAPDQPLTIRLKSPLYRCTLPAPTPNACEQTFAAGASGRFEILARD